MNILEKIKKDICYFDGGMGTLLQAMGLQPGELPETWNIRHPERIIELHSAYLAAGSNVVSSNTFGANSFKYDGKDGTYDLEEIVRAGVENAKKAAAAFDGDRYAALDIGPLGKMLQPYGSLPFEDAVERFAEVVRIGADAGADLIIIETMNDCYETKAAVLAAKENSSLPVFVTNVYDESGKLMTGADIPAMVAMLEGLGVDAIGMNCSLGPKQMIELAPKMLMYSSLPVIVNPNAGLPRSENGRTVYDVTADEFAAYMEEMAKMGVGILGGCCGTTPDYIRKVVSRTAELELRSVEDKGLSLVCSYTHAVELGKKPVLIGERINPTGKKALKQALREHDIGYILSEGISQQEKGVDILDVNVGLPEINEVQMMSEAVAALQSVVDCPLQIDSSDPAAMEAALRLYNGKAMINSVNGKAEVMDSIFPLAKKYGGLIVCLTLDENGIPETAEGRLEIARRIKKRAEEYGIKAKDLIFDPLALSVSSDAKAALTTLESIRLIGQELDCMCSLGVSNISFGLPCRDFINSTFFAMALQNGLKSAIMNPNSHEMMKCYRSYLALTAQDEACRDYICFAENAAPASSSASAAVDNESLTGAIVKGLKEKAAAVTAKLLESSGPLSLINEQIIPALDIVGKGFEEKTVYLPQLLMSAEAATAAFKVVRAAMPEVDGSGPAVLLATVKGDIHDIGKNIVKVLLENYGYRVIDLGKDIEPEAIVERVMKDNIQLVGLSALMTTTVPAMERTIKALKDAGAECKVIVGGAVLTQDYADTIGADAYGKSAMDTVRYADRHFKKS